MLLYIISIISVANALVIFEQEPKILILNKTVIIKCTFENISDNNLRWSINGNILFYNLNYSDNKYKSKFNASIIKNTYILKIFNLNEADLISYYECNNDPDKYLTLLQVNNKTFKYIPDIMMKQSESLIGLKFKKSFPKPICLAKLNNKTNSFITQKEIKINPIYYETILKFKAENEYCENNFTILCTLNNTQFFSIIKSINCTEPIKKIKEKGINYDLIILILISVCSIILIIVLIILIYCYHEKIKIYNKKTNNKIEIKMLLIQNEN